jgi:outer membrane protein assembly factor BamB
MAGRTPNAKRQTPNAERRTRRQATAAGSGILWAMVPLNGTTTASTPPGILRAFDASDVSKELWDSQQNATRDAMGNVAKFTPPTIANGKVYLATRSGYLDVYGLLP